MISLCCHEIEMRGIYRKKCVKETTTLVWGYIWEGALTKMMGNFVDWGVENRGMGMINIQLLIDSKRNKLPCRILPVLLNVPVSLDCSLLIAPSVFSSIYLYEQVESWNAIVKYWFLCNLDIKFNEKYFFM